MVHDTYTFRLVYDIDREVPERPVLKRMQKCSAQTSKPHGSTFCIDIGTDIGIDIGRCR